MQIDLYNVEQDIAKKKYEMGLADQVIKLNKNKEFKEIILNHYIKEQSLALIKAKGAMNLSVEAERNLDKAIYGVSSLQAFLTAILTTAGEAEQTIGESERLREQLLAQGMEE